MWMLAAYPFAIFFSAVYSESLYLLGVVGAFYHFRRRGIRARGPVGPARRPRPRARMFSLGVARVHGDCAVAAVVARRRFSDGVRSRAFTARALATAMVSAAMPGIGMLLFSAFVWRLTGHPLAWEEGHAAWGRTYSGLGVLVSQRADWLWHGGLYAYTSGQSGDLVNALGAIFVLATVWPVARRLGTAYAVFILINILPPLAAGGFLSAGRFSSVLFPSFVWLGERAAGASASRVDCELHGGPGPVRLALLYVAAVVLAP